VKWFKFRVVGILKSYVIGISSNCKLKTDKIFIFMCVILRDMQIKKGGEDSESRLGLYIVWNISASTNSCYQALQKYWKSTCKQQHSIITDWGLKQDTLVCIQAGLQDGWPRNRCRYQTWARDFSRQISHPPWAHQASCSVDNRVSSGEKLTTQPV
jgi:hypothetical protein